MSGIGRKLLFIVFNVFAHIYNYLLKATCTYHYSEKLIALLQSSEPVIIATFHQDVLTTFSFLLKYGSKRRLCSISSLSKDGEIAAYLMERLGIKAVRGSSSREGLKGFLEISRLIRKEKDLVIFICDGPRRPFGQIRPGVVMLSSLTGVPIYIVRTRAKHQLVLEKSPPKLWLPRPFSEIAVLETGPIQIKKRCIKEDLKKYQSELQTAFDKLILEADTYFNA